MAELQAIKRRIRSVGNTRQITKAMQLVAASKLRHAQEAAQTPLPYLEAIRGLLGRLGNTANLSKHPLYAKRAVSQALAIIVTSDRGLAGAYNNNLFRELGRLAREIAIPITAITIGRRGASHTANAEGVDEIAAYEMDASDADTGLAQPILAEAMALFTSGEVDVVYLVSTRYHSSSRQEVQTQQLLPVLIEASEVGAPEAEPNLETVLDVATERLLEAEVYQAIVEARASEQAARMIAMMNATDNASDLIEDLTLARNNARQAAITQELAEISGGAEAVTHG